MVPLKAPMISRKYGPNLRYATCWAVERTDGVTLRITNHNSNLTVNGNVYYAASGFRASARERQSNLQDRNAELRGFLSSDYITEEDLRAGKYRDATIIELTVDWLVPWAGIYLTNVYYVEDITFTGEVWLVNVIGQTSRLRKPLGTVYSRLCRHDLGSEYGTTKVGCKVNLAALAVSGNVDTVTTQRNAFKTDLTEANGYFNRGLITWTSGANDNTNSEVQSYHLTDGKIVLFLPTPYDIEAGDSFTITPGCDKMLGTCKDKFNNVVNFGGHPYIPGTDKMLKIPPPAI